MLSKKLAEPVELVTPAPLQSKTYTHYAEDVMNANAFCRTSVSGIGEKRVPKRLASMTASVRRNGAVKRWSAIAPTLNIVPVSGRKSIAEPLYPGPGIARTATFLR